MRRYLVMAIMLSASVVSAQRHRDPPDDGNVPRRPPPACKKSDKQPCTQDITINDPLSLGGKLRVLSMLGFLERANEELERASLEKKSFVPKLVQSVDEEAL